MSRLCSSRGEAGFVGKVFLIVAALSFAALALSPIGHRYWNEGKARYAMNHVAEEALGQANSAVRDANPNTTPTGVARRLSTDDITVQVFQTGDGNTWCVRVWWVGDGVKLDPVDRGSC